MRLVFIKDVGRYKRGEIRDYPTPTWAAIERSARLSLGRFTQPVDEAAQQSVKSKK